MSPFDLNYTPWSSLSGIGAFLLALYYPFVHFIKSFFGILIGISFPISLISFLGIIYAVEQLKLVRKKEEEIYDLKVEPAFEETKGDQNLSKRWQTVLKHTDSDNPNDWKQAIIEADIILDEILTKMGYQGASVGEKLKRVAKGDFGSLEQAWEGHKVRNRIAHDGSAFTMNHHEAKVAISHYRSVFEEFYFIN